MAGALREVFARFGVEVDSKKLDDLNKKVDGGVSSLQKFGTVLVGALGAHAIFRFAEGLAEQGSQILDNSRRLGIGTDAYQALGYAAKITGASVEALGTALLISQDKLVDASKGSKEAGKAFSDLGIAIKEPNGDLRDSQAVLLDAAEAISKMDSPARQTAAAVNLFGRQGRQLLPFLKEGREGITKLTAEFGELGGGFDKAAVAASDNFGDALDRANATITSLRGRIATALLPVLQRLVDWFTKAVAWFVRLAKSTKIVETALLTLGTVLAAFAIRAAIAMAPAIAPFLFWGAIIGGIIIVLEDLWGTFEGKDSLIRRVVDGLFGIGTTAEGVRELKDAWSGFKDGVVAVLPYLREAWEIIKNIVEKGAAVYGKTLGLAAKAGGAVGDFLGSAAGRDAETAYTLNNPNARSSQETVGGRMGLVGGASISAPAPTTNASTNYSPNIIVNAGNADARETARMIKEEFDRGMATVNRAAAQALTREAPAR